MFNKIVEYCMKRWPKKLNKEGEIKHCWKLRNEISVEEKLVYYRIRLVIPTSLKKYILTKLHETHMVITKNSREY